MTKHLTLLLFIGLAWGQTKDELKAEINILKAEIKILKKELKEIRYDVDDLYDEVSKFSRRSKRMAADVNTKLKNYKKENQEKQNTSIQESNKVYSVYQPNAKEAFAPIFELLGEVETNLNSGNINTGKRCQFDGTLLMKFGGQKVEDGLTVYEHQCTSNPKHYYWIP